MFKSLSKSTYIMFLFDLLVFSLSTYYWYTHFDLPMYLGIPIALIVLTGLVSLFLKANYKIREFNITKKNTYLLFEGVVFAHIPALFLLFFVSGLTVEKFLIANILTIFLILKIYRALFHYYLFNIKRTKNILIIGTNRNAKIIAEEINNKKALKMEVVGFVEDTQSNEEKVINENLYKPEQLKELIASNQIDIVIIAIKRRMEEDFLTNMVFSIPKRVKIYKMPEFYEMVTGKYYVDTMSINWLFYEFMDRRSCVYDFCKRAFDIIAASIVLLVTLPLLAYIAIRVKLTDGGSPVFTQNRVGREGKIFKMYKLRTMYVNDFVPKNASDLNDGSDRVIPFCKFIRKARFDEIPQMINILKGEMSIVGPRAEWEDFVKVFEKDLPYYKLRMWTKTGWTGWAHINMAAAYSLDEEKERVAYDLYYLKHRNVLWEICILVKAVFLAVGGRHK